MEKGKKESARERIAKKFDIELDILMGGFQVEMRGRHRVKLGGVGKILCYSDTEICLGIGKDVLSVVGTNLECMSFCHGCAVIVGRVDGLAFEKKGMPV